MRERAVSLDQITVQLSARKRSGSLHGNRPFAFLEQEILHPTARQLKGMAAERAVADHLRRGGYDVLALNLRVGRLEVDVVARQGPVIAVVEVRSRGAGAWTTGMGSISPAKRRRVRLAGDRLWKLRFRHDPTVERVRFDAASVEWTECGRVLIDYAVAAF